jgi:hypothetical protein
VVRGVALLVSAGVVLQTAPIAGQAGGGGGDAGEPRAVQVATLSPRAEKAIDIALRRLAETQQKDGGWGGGHRAASAALSLMAFMLKGHFPKRGRYGTVTDKAVGFLLNRAKQGAGYFGGNMYEHALATLALSEVWGMSDRKEIRDTLKLAVEVILRSQSPRGGWRYHPQPRDADISVTVMQIVALASAKEAGIYVPQKTIDRALAYVKSLQVRFTGGFGYTRPTREGFARSAAGVMSLLMCGVDVKSREVQGGLGYLTRYPNTKFVNCSFYYYAHYYAVQAMYQAGEKYYQAWYPQIQQALLRRQRSDGSWTGGRGGTAYSTAMAVLILGVPYRYLPIYQR